MTDLAVLDRQAKAASRQLFIASNLRQEIELDRKFFGDDSASKLESEIVALGYRVEPREVGHE